MMTLSDTDCSHARRLLSAEMFTSCGASSSIEIAYRNPCAAPEKFSVGEMYARTVTAPLSRSHIQYSRRGLVALGVWLAIVTGSAVIPDSVRPRSGMRVQRIGAAP